MYISLHYLRYIKDWTPKDSRRITYRYKLRGPGESGTVPHYTNAARPETLRYLKLLHGDEGELQSPIVPEE